MRLAAKSAGRLRPVARITIRRPLKHVRTYDTGEAGEDSCTLVTQCSIDRLGRLITQAAHWRGAVAAAVVAYDGATGEHVAVREARRRIEAAVVEIGACGVGVGLPVRRTIALYEDGGLGLYPINAARNAALRLATTELVLLLDVDFLPSTGLHSTVAGSAAELRRRCVEERRLLVLPAFESCADACEAAALAAGGKPALAAAVVAGRARTFASDGRCGDTFPQGHRATDSKRWLATDGAYSVEHEEGFEPFVVASRRLVPPYDERFTGFGRNKILQLWEAARLCGFTFEVVPSHFVVHARHAASHAQRAVLGDPAAAEPGPRLLPSIKALYDRARLERLRAACGSGGGGGGGGGAVEPMGCFDVGAALASDTSEAEALAMYELRFRFGEARLVAARGAGGDGSWLRSRLRRAPTDITLVTCLTDDRIERLAAQCSLWSGVVSAAVLLPRRPAAAWRARARLSSLHAKLEREGSGCRLDLTLLRPARRGSSCGGSSCGAAPLVPINALRNAALEAARTDLVLLLDVDLLPSKGLHERLCAARLRRALAASCEAGEVWVLPAVEMSSTGARQAISLDWEAKEAQAEVATGAEQAQQATGAEQLQQATGAEPMEEQDEDEDEAEAIRRSVSIACLPLAAVAQRVRSGALRSFHSLHYEQGHGATDLSRWADEVASAGDAGDGSSGDSGECTDGGGDGGDGESIGYAVEFEEGYEPFVLASRRRLPRYEERFRGYGFDKVFFFLQLHEQQRPRFRVLPCGLAVDVPHRRSPDWHATFRAADSRGHRLQLLRTRALYSRCKRELALQRQFAAVLAASDDAAAIACLRAVDARESLSLGGAGAAFAAAQLPPTASAALSVQTLCWRGELVAEAAAPLDARLRLAALLCTSATATGLPPTPALAVAVAVEVGASPPRAAVAEGVPPPLLWGGGGGWRLLTTRGMRNCAVVYGPSLPKAGPTQPGTEAAAMAAAAGAAPCSVAPAERLRVALPRGSWSPFATLASGLEVGGVAVRAHARLPPGTDAAALSAVSYALRFPSGFEWALGGTLPGVFLDSGLRLSLGWRAAGCGHVSFTSPRGGDAGAVTRLGTWHWVPDRWHFVVISRSAAVPSGADRRFAVYVDEQPVAVVDPPQSGPLIGAVVASPPEPLGLLLTLFFGGATDEWATPRDTHVEVGGFTCWKT